MDRRIAELQSRLARKRQLNTQLANQISQRRSQHLAVATVEPRQAGGNSLGSQDDLITSKLDELGEFVSSKNDPKYKTLPSNTKFHPPQINKDNTNGGGGGAPSDDDNPPHKVPALHNIPNSLPR